MLVSLTEAGGIYFITFTGCSDFVKIGQAVCFSKRFSTLQTASPHPLNIELIFPVNSLDYKALDAVEKMFHSKFSPYRHRGEWFVRSGELASFIEKRQRLNKASTCSYGNTSASTIYGWDYSELRDEAVEIKGFNVLCKLSERELECAVYVSQGLDNDDIAKQMNVSKETVKTFIRLALQKLQLTNRTQLAVEVVKRNL